MFSNKNLLKICPKFYCETCDYGTSKKSSYNDHLISSKHVKSMNSNEILPKICSASICNKCNKKYKDNSGLWRHKKKCMVIEDVIVNNECIDSKMILQIIQQNQEAQQQTQEAIKQNQELQKQMIDICKNGNNTTNNVQTNNTNCNNKSFNLNVFLNETCKDAMNMKDFVDSIQITLTDIENMGKLGFVNGITNIIVNRLKAIDVHMRPVHCTDQRRETMYVKEKNQWNKEEEDNKNIRTFIQLVAHKNTRNLSLFKNKHPDCLEYHSKYNDQYNTIVMETFGGYGNTDYDSENKIIRKLVKELSIDKSN